MSKHLIIQAGGQGSRLAPYTDNIPKLFKTVNGKTVYQRIKENLILFGLLEPEHKTSIILHPKYQEFVGYAEGMFENIRVVYDRDQNGDLGCIKEVFDLEDSEDAIVHWSDFVLTKVQTTIKKNEEWFGLTITDKEKYRLKLFGNAVVGCFKLIKNCFLYKSLVNCLKMEDLISIIHDKARKTPIWEYNYFGRIVYFECTQFGTLEEVLSDVSSSSPRSWNKIEFNGGLVKKTSERPVDKEVNWLKFVYGKNFIKEIDLETNTYTLPYINAHPPVEMGENKLPKFLKFENNSLQKDHEYDLDKRETVVLNVINELCKLHNKKSKITDPIRIKDLIFKSLVVDVLERFEIYCEKLDKNAREYKPLIEQFTRNYSQVVYNHLYTYGQVLLLVHGDSTLNNCLVDKETNKVTFIDPKSDDLFGIPAYDFAKLYYSITGYSQVNTGTAWHSNSNEFFNQESNNKIFEDNYFFQALPAHKKDILIILPLIWIRFAGYSWETPQEAMLGFKRGIRLIEEYNRRFN